MIGSYFIKPPGNFKGIPLNTGKLTAEKITIDEDFRHFLLSH
jgi:hypothetical protein